MNKNNIDIYLILLLLISFISTNGLIHLATILITLRSCFYLFVKKKNLQIFTQVPKIIKFSLAAFFLLACLTNLTKIDEMKIISKSFREYKWILVYFMYVYYFYMTYHLNIYKKLKSFSFIMFIVFLYSALQFFYGLDYFGDHSRFMGPQFPYRSIGFFGIPITFSYMIGGVFFLALPYCSSMISTLPKRSKSLIYFTLFIMFLTVLTTQTRISWISFYFTFCVLSFFYIQKLRKIAIVSLLSIPLIYMAAPQNLKNRITSVVDVKEKGINSGRLYVWRAHTQIFKDNVFIGNGISNYKGPVKDYYDKLEIKSKLIAHAHNTFLHVLSSQGVLGFIPFIIFYFYFLILAFRGTKSKANKDKWVSIGVFGALIYLYIGGMTEVLLIDSETIHLLCFLWAIATVISMKGKEGPLSRNSLK